VHCKNIRISADILWRVFRILTEPVPYTFVSVNRRNDEAHASSFTDTKYAEPVPLKCGKLATKYLWIYGYFYSVLCAANKLNKKLIALARKPRDAQ